MYRFSLITLVLSLAVAASASTPITPTITLAAETSNNTSAASTFTGMSNGNIAATNVSKVSIKSMMYPGFNGKMYAHLMGWFGPSNHVSVGYASNDATQVARQVTDINSRGYDGLILDWYGPSHGIEDQVAQLLLAEAPKHPNFTWALIEDVGALKTCANTSGCDVTAKLISDLTYAYNNYEQSPSYVRVNGRPMVAFFGVETLTGIDWTRVSAGVPGNPVFIWRNSNGYTKPLSNGSFAWINVNKSDPTDIGSSYLDNLYTAGLSYPTKSTLATGYKGFNDSAASWGSNRLMNQTCGQTWLKSTAEAGKYYSSTLDVYGVQIATWNDYEEGTEVETGIDNCVTISASVVAKQLSWTITGQENTLDHYTVFISTDGQNLMPLADVATGTHSFDLSQLALDPTNYTLFVKAVGKPSMVNHMSTAVNYSIANQPPVAALSATPGSGIAPVAVTASTAGSTDSDGTVASSTINWGDGFTTSGSTGTHTYTAPGTYTLVATVTDNLGATSTASKTVSVMANQPPVAKLSVTPATGVAPVAVTASTAGSSDVDGTITSTTINWGDGTSIAAASGAHTYLVAGTFTIKAALTDNLGASSYASATVTVTAPPVATTTGAVTVSSPIPNSTVGTSVHITAKAAATSPANITAMKIYVDGVSKYSTSSASINTYLTMSKAKHSLTINAWDSTGKVYKSSMSITVQ